MSDLNLPVRWYGGAGYYEGGTQDEDGHCYDTLPLAAARTAFLVVMLHDGTHSAEYPDTVDASLPEGGWLRKVMLRNFEHIVGYTSTAAKFAEACRALEASDA